VTDAVHEETLRRIARSQAGDGQAEAALVSDNLALVKSVVRRYLYRGVEYDDLYQLGCVGLVKAIQNFDASYGVRFSTYAVPLIAGEIKRFLRDDGMVKVSRSVKELAVRAEQLSEATAATTGRAMTVTELAEALGASPEDVAMALDAVLPVQSLSAPLGDDEKSAERLDFVEDSACEELYLDRLFVKDLLSLLEARERKIIVLRYFRDQTQQQVAHALGISQVQVSRLENRILKKLRDAAGESKP